MIVKRITPAQIATTIIDLIIEAVLLSVGKRIANSYMLIFRFAGNFPRIDTEKARNKMLTTKRFGGHYVAPAFGACIRM